MTNGQGQLKDNSAGLMLKRETLLTTEVPALECPNCELVQLVEGCLLQESADTSCRKCATPCIAKWQPDMDCKMDGLRQA